MEQEAIDQVQAYIKAHIKDEFTLGELAMKMGYSPYHLSRSFKVAMGYTIKEYTRSCRVVAASSDIARGKNICNTAMEHCFETHAGFTRAFISIIGCAPKYYKELNMNIKTAITADVLRSVLEFSDKEIKEVYGNVYSPKPGEKYSYEFWEEQIRRYPTLLLYSEKDGKITGSAFGWVDGDCVTAGHCCVLKNRRKEGIGRVLMNELEKCTLALGYHGIALGTSDNAAEFYEKLGYSAAILIQSQKDSIEDLLKLAEGCEVIYTNIYEGYINQVSMRANPSEVAKIRGKYQSVFPESYVQVVMGKNF